MSEKLPTSGADSYATALYLGGHPTRRNRPCKYAGPSLPRVRRLRVTQTVRRRPFGGVGFVHSTRQSARICIRSDSEPHGPVVLRRTVSALSARHRSDYPIVLRVDPCRQYCSFNWWRTIIVYISSWYERGALIAGSRNSNDRATAVTGQRADTGMGAKCYRACRLRGTAACIARRGHEIVQFWRANAERGQVGAVPADARQRSVLRAAESFP